MDNITAEKMIETIQNDLKTYFSQVCYVSTNSQESAMPELKYQIANLLDVTNGTWHQSHSTATTPTKAYEITVSNGSDLLRLFPLKKGLVKVDGLIGGKLLDYVVIGNDKKLLCEFADSQTLATNLSSSKFINLIQEASIYMASRIDTNIGANYGRNNTSMLSVTVSLNLKTPSDSSKIMIDALGLEISNMLKTHTMVVAGNTVIPQNILMYNIGLQDQYNIQSKLINFSFYMSYRNCK